MPKAKCQVCGLDENHVDLGDCMRDLMRYVQPEIRETPEFQRALAAGVEAMRTQLENDPIPIG